jgi:hypothetical protein
MITRLYLTSRLRAGGVLAACVVTACSNGASVHPPVEEEQAELAPPQAVEAPSLAARLALPPPTSRSSAEERAARPLAKASVDREARAVSAPAAAGAVGRTPVPVVPAPVISIAGLTEAEILSVMGEPQQRAERSGRRIWTYTGADCRVEVTFFRDVTGGAYAALSQKVVAADGRPRETCERSVRSASR